MKQDEIVLSDIARLVFGQNPPTFLLEVIGRAVICFVLIIIALRLLGRRVASQYTLFELSAVVTLAGTMGVPLLDDKRGLLPPLLVIDGRLALEHLHHAEFSRDRAFSELRSFAWSGPPAGPPDNPQRVTRNGFL
ncbi:hypothetical protein [Pantoea brenneri]|uniref:hypothetical protein n=1 Tax=Pantoea brenneri TaxID=472694 RepID=UPI00289D7B59|nr:hypothetical protein [Pantoea brenneri]